MSRRVCILRSTSEMTPGSSFDLHLPHKLPSAITTSQSLQCVLKNRGEIICISFNIIHCIVYQIFVLGLSVGLLSGGEVTEMLRQEP